MSSTKPSPSVAVRLLVKVIRLAFRIFVALFVCWGLLYLSFQLLLHAAHKSLQSHPDPVPDYAAAVSRFQVDFPKAMQIEHDMIDPSHPGQQIQIVYPVLVSLLDAP